jgi:hypothetical protein
MESKLLQTKGIGDFSSVTACYFGSCTPAAALGACTALQALLGNCSLRCSRLWHPASLYLVHPWTRTSCIPAVVRKWAERSRFPGYPRQIATAIFLGSPKICPRSPTPSLRAPMRYRLLASRIL